MGEELQIRDDVPMPPLDPLTCELAVALHAKGIESLSGSDKFKLAIHIATGIHEEGCPGIDTTLLPRLRTELGFDDLPDT